MRNAGKLSVSSDDEGALQFDPRYFESGDRVEVYLDGEHRWASGRFEISTAGSALVQLDRGPIIKLDAALAMGVRRILN